MKHIVLILALMFFGVACNESGSNTNQTTTTANASTGSATTSTTVEAIDTTNKSTGLEAYTKSTFSDFIYLHKTDNKLLVTYDFFPAGYDLCQQATYNAQSNPNGCTQNESVSIPCTFSSVADDDLLSVSINAETDAGEPAVCASPIIVDLTTAEFTVDGLVFDVTSGAVDVFAEDFEFLIDVDGFYDSTDDAILNLTDSIINLESVYDAVISKRTS